MLRMTNAVIAPRERASELIAREIRAELGRQQLSNRRLAAALGVSFMWVNRRISTGETHLTVEDTERIANALGVPLAQLLAAWIDSAPSPQRPTTLGLLDPVFTASSSLGSNIAMRTAGPHTGSEWPPATPIAA